MCECLNQDKVVFGSPPDPPDDNWFEYEPVDCPECGVSMDYDPETEKYKCHTEFCEISNRCLPLTLEQVYDLMDSELATMSN